MSMEVEVINIPADYNRLLGRTWVYDMAVIRLILRSKMGLLRKL